MRIGPTNYGKSVQEQNKYNQTRPATNQKIAFGRFTDEAKKLFNSEAVRNKIAVHPQAEKIVEKLKQLDEIKDLVFDFKSQIHYLNYWGNKTSNHKSITASCIEIPGRMVPLASAENLSLTNFIENTDELIKKYNNIKILPLRSLEIEAKEINIGKTIENLNTEEENIFKTASKGDIFSTEHETMPVKIDKNILNKIQSDRNNLKQRLKALRVGYRTPEETEQKLKPIFPCFVDIQNAFLAAKNGEERWKDALDELGRNGLLGDTYRIRD